MKNLFLLGALSALFFFSSCGEEELSNINGAQSSFGLVGNTIDVRAGQLGFSDEELYVTKLENGVSTLHCSGTNNNTQLMDLLKLVPADIFPGTMTITGNTIEAEVNAKITDKGFQAIYNDGSALTLVNYDAKVGDKFSATVGGITLENEVIEKSTDDDFFWGGMLIKVITVKYKNPTPGVSSIEHIYNHKFGLVSISIHFEDGTVKYIGVEC